MKKHVGVIVHTANRNRYEVDVVADASQVLPQSVLNILWNELPALFRTEHYVQMILGKRMRHDLSPLPGLHCITTCSPTTFCPCRAWQLVTFRRRWHFGPNERASAF